MLGHVYGGADGVFVGVCMGNLLGRVNPLSVQSTIRRTLLIMKEPRV